MFAHESATIAQSIEYLRNPEAVNSATAGGWLKEFRAQRLCSMASLEAGILNLRFVVDDELIVSIARFIFLVLNFNFISPALNLEETIAPC